MFALLTFIKFMRKNQTITKKVFTTDQAAEVARNAMAFGWEIAMGAPLADEINASPANPFMYDDWRDAIVNGVPATNVHFTDTWRKEIPDAKVR